MASDTMIANSAAGGAQPVLRPWIALVQAGMLVGKFANRSEAGMSEATHMALADGRGIEAYEVDPSTSQSPPLGTEVEPALWGWVRVS